MNYKKNNAIVFTLNSGVRTELFKQSDKKTLVVLPTSTALNESFTATTKKFRLDPFKVMRALVDIYLKVRKSTQEDPNKALRALLRMWLAKAQNGHLVGFERFGWTA